MANEATPIDYERLAKLVAAELAPLLRPPEFANAKNNPLRNERAFLDAGRRGDFPTFRAADRQIVARWSDVLAYIESRPIPRRRRPRVLPANETLDPSALLDEVMSQSRGRRVSGQR
jgi:hypothetical protein